MSRRLGAARATTLMVALTTVLLLVGPGVPPAVAETCDGVWVVVDARGAGGSLTTRCAPGDPPTGLAALERAGHAYGFVPRIPGMVCTIDARPDPCNGAPADAYWSYWYAEAGGSWTYASVGAGSRDPAPGTVEGWRFGDGSTPPGTPPPAAQAPPAPAPAPSPDAPAASQPAPSAGTGTTTPGPDADATVDRTRRPSSTTTDQEPSPPHGPSEPEASAAAEPPSSEADDASQRQLLDPRMSASLPRPRSQTDAGRGASTTPTATEEPDVATEPAPEPTDPEVGQRTLAASPADERSSTPLLGPFLAVGLLVGIGALTWRQRRQRGESTS